MKNNKKSKNYGLKLTIEYLIAITIIKILLKMPYRIRVQLSGWISSLVLFPILGWNKRIKYNIRLALPEANKRNIHQIMMGCSNNFGRLIVEIFSPNDLKDVARKSIITGPGYEKLKEALITQRPVICVSGHFGNYDVFRSALIQMGFNVGAIYRPMNNHLFNDFYERTICALGGAMFPRSRNGLARMITHLRNGNLVAMLIDQHSNSGAILNFFNQPAQTATSAAQLALKYDTLLIPIYAIRQPDGLSFCIEVENPIEYSNPEVMTQTLNDSIEKKIRKHPEQWLWTHRRWKVRTKGK